jgi:phosphoglycolate phosphatase-like HAD superfamily hydrolase
MKKKKLTAGERYTKITEQRFAFVILLCNILDSDEVANDVKSAVAASLLNTIEMSFIPGDDDGLSNLINNSINQFCEKIEEEKGIENYRSKLLETVELTRTVLKRIDEKIQRIREGEDILKGICLN